MNVLAIFIGGGLGASARYLVSELIDSTILVEGISLLVINCIGSIVAGILLGYYLGKEQGILFSFLLVGCLGGFTTFSSFSVSIVHAFQVHGIFHSLGLLLLHNTLAVVGCGLGYYFIK